MTNLAPFPRAKNIEKSNIKTPIFDLNKTEHLSNLVVMSGSAKRRRLETDDDLTVKLTPDDFKEKLRAPFYKSHHKQAQTGERLMTKSCEILLECIKPYKEIRVDRRTQMTESTRTIGSILTTNIVYEKKATRKVRFVSFSQENPLETAFPYEQKSSSVLMTNTSANSDFVFEPGADLTFPDFFKTVHKQHTGKTVSSEDFITKVFTDSEESIFV